MNNKTIAIAIVAISTTSVSHAILGHFEGFEDPGFSVGTGSSQNWNKNQSDVQRVASGTAGITSFAGGFHGVVDSTNVGQTGAYTRLGGYSSTFGGGFTTKLAVYLDKTAASANGGSTYGFDLTSAASNSTGGHRRDFIFHAASDANGDILIGGSNNTNFARRNDLASINHYKVTQSGWYQFEWVFRDNAGVLAVDLNLRDAGGSWLWTETRSDASDLIPIIGGNRYMWFTFASTPTIAIDNTQVVPEPATMAALGLGALAVVRRRKRTSA